MARKHSETSGEHTHIQIKFEYENYTHRINANMFTNKDLYCVALQKDDYSL